MAGLTVGPVHRATARVLPVAPDGSVLLLQDQDPARPGILRWGSIGGAIDDGESLLEAALRELREETGIVGTAAQLLGPVDDGTHAFRYDGVDYVGHSTFFALPLTRDVEVSFAGLEPAEVGNVLGWGWWDPEDLAADGTAVAPELPDAMRAAVAEVRHRVGDGTLPPYRVAARVAPVDDDGRVLLLRERAAADAAPARGTVGGGVDPGETLRAAAVREMSEEVGVRVSAQELRGPVQAVTLPHAPGDPHRGHHVLFAVRLSADAETSFAGLVPEEVGNVLEARWISPDDLEDALAADPSDPSWPGLPAVLRLAVERING